MSTSSSRHAAPSVCTSDSTESVSRNLDSNVDDKPALPYTLGATFIAHRHEPPPPFGHGYDTPWPPFKTGYFRLPQTNYCLIRPPIEGRTLDESRALTITELIRTGYSYGAQIIAVNGNMVAKIYDPLYDAGGDCYDNKRDVVVLADGDYSREAAAYEELQRCPVVREYTPAYHGSWTIEVPTTVDDHIYLRHVRLILMEHITDTVMSNIQPLLPCLSTRSTIMKKVLEAESLIFNAGILHRDMSPRNVIIVSPLSSPSFDDPDLRVVIIDFNVSNVIRLSASRLCHINPTFIQQQWPGKILGPVTRFWDAMQEFEARDWVNDEYGKANEWLWKCFGQRGEYVPLIRDWGDREACPRVDWCGESKDGCGEGGRNAMDTVESLGASGGGDDEGDDEVVFQGWGCEVSVSS